MTTEQLAMPPNEALTTTEQQELERHEAVIARGVETFVEVGNALAAIRDARLYRQGYATFDAYCRERWEIGRQRAYQLMGAASVVGNLSTIVDTAPPSNEAQTRPLAGLSVDQQREIWQEASASAPNGKPTAAHVQQIVSAKTAPADDAPHLPADFALARQRAKKLGLYLAMSASGRFSLTYEATHVVAGTAETWPQVLAILAERERQGAALPPAQATLPIEAEQEIAVAPVLTPLTPPPPAASDDQALIQSAAMLLYCRKLAALAQRDWDVSAKPHLDAGNVPVVLLDEAQAETAARMALASPSMRAQAGMLTFGATVTIESWDEESVAASDDEEI